MAGQAVQKPISCTPNAGFIQTLGPDVTLSHTQQAVFVHIPADELSELKLKGTDTA